MSCSQKNLRMSAAWMGVIAAALILFPAISVAQDTQPDEISVVTDLYDLESLLPVMSSAELGSVKDISAWCLSMAKSFKARLADAQDEIGLQRETKRAEIKTLEARVKAAGKEKNEDLKKALAAELREQRFELDILDAVKELTAQEAAASGDFEAAGKSLKSLVAAYKNLSEDREDAGRVLERAIEEAGQSGIAAPGLEINYSRNETALKVFGEAGKNVNDLGERLIKVAKARQGLLKAWQRLIEAKAEL